MPLFVTSSYVNATGCTSRCTASHHVGSLSRSHTATPFPLAPLPRFEFVTTEFTQPPDHVPSAHVDVTEPGFGTVLEVGVAEGSAMLGGGSERLVIFGICVAVVPLLPFRSTPLVRTPFPQPLSNVCWPGNCDCVKLHAYCVLLDTHPRTGTVPNAAEPAASADCTNCVKFVLPVALGNCPPPPLKFSK